MKRNTLLVLAIALTALSIIAVTVPVMLRGNEPVPHTDRHSLKAASWATPRPDHVDQDMLAVSAGLNAFTADMYRKIAAKNKSGNINLSPASISMAFAIVQAGTKGATAREIAQTLHYPALGDALHPAIGRVLASLNTQAKGAQTLAINNSIWMQNEISVNSEWSALVRRNYGAGLQRTDFSKDSEAARETINRWVDEKTRHKINDLLQPSDISKDTASILINTIYFNGSWMAPFDARKTKPGRFSTLSGKSAQRQFMNAKFYPKYAKDKDTGLQLLAMPYFGTTEMVVALPKDRNALHELEHSLDGAMIVRWVELLAARVDRPTLVTIPKFEIKQRFSDMRPILEQMGMVTAFSDTSDFSGIKPVKIASANALDRNLKIDKVVHETTFELDERGTEASAATAVVMEVVTTATPPLNPKEPHVFRADHPFLYLIRDQRTGAILFIGRYAGE